MIIAVDGPAASGKGTIARALARHFGLPFLDTGVLYRAVGWLVVREGRDPGDEAAAVAAAARVREVALDDPALRGEAAAGAASRVSAFPGVRQALLQLQRDFARQPGGAVLDGRDIGTVIVPHAEAKLFVTADAQVRARRRHAELAAAGAGLSFEQVLAEVMARDARDAARTTAPLVRAPDADLLDTSAMTIDEAVRRAITLVEARIVPVL